jgi:hypothetical protein
VFTHYITSLPWPPKPPDRCDEIRAQCFNECWDDAQYEPGLTDKLGWVRQCTRTCMARKGCFSF